MESDASHLIRKLVVIAASSVLPTPVLSIGEAAFDFASKKWDRPAAQVERNLRKVTPTATSQERANGLRYAVDALEKSALTLDELAADDFDASRAARRIEPHLDSSLLEQERLVAMHAVRLSLQATINEAKKSNDDLRAYSRQSRGTLETIERGVRTLHEQSRAHAPFGIRSKHIVDSHRLSDPLHLELYVGRLPELALKQFARDWRDDLRLHVTELCDMRSADSRTRVALNTLERLQFHGTYPSVWRELQAPETREAISRIRSFLARDSNLFQPVQYDLALRWLERQVKRPEFSLAFAVSGSWGAGKTRLLDRIAETGSNQGWLPIHLEAMTNRPLKDEVFSCFEESLGMRVGSMPELRSVLDGRRGSIVVVDDWDVLSRREPSRLRELGQLIESLSDLNVRWAISLDESALPKVLSNDGMQFWERYGCTGPVFQPDRSIVSGWLLLDDENESESVGLRIIAGTLPGRRALEVERAGLEERNARMIKRSLSTPVVALLKLNLSPSLPLDEIHVVTLMNEYWSLMKSSLTRADGVSPDAVDAVCEAIGFARLAGGSASFSDVGLSRAPDGYLEQEWMSALRAAVVCLRNRSIVVVASPGDRLLPSPSVELLWGFLTSREVERCSPQLGLAGLPYAKEVLLAIAGRDHGIRTESLKTVLRFLLVASALEFERSEPESQRPYLHWLGNPDLPNDVLWEAATVLPSGVQSRLISEALAVADVADDEPFWALRMLRLCEEPSSREVLDHLRFADRVANQANRTGLQEYLLLVLQGLVRRVNWSVPRDAHKALTLIHRMSTPRTAEPLSRAVVAELSFEDPSRRVAWLQTLARFLTVVGEDGGPGNLDLPFWRDVTQRSILKLSASAGPNVILEMLEAGVFAPSWRGQRLSRSAGHFFRRSAHVAFGHTRDTDSRRFDELALKLIRGELEGASPERQALAALFGIRHTVATGGHSVTVDRDLKMHLTLLKRSRHIPRDMKRWVDSIKVDDEP
ncbi:hypothetical protein GCM10009868_40790 [Terrabacter aerolatus]|uniref:Uncharacterized protein n=1 Tax=Terrabacter aerolatus TaxID=422442 RepID=A0A512D5Z7_9MICO|nr:hypothetical protein [Terrabacter aerolatus]GEO31893.1 hypothetical protein TAE01_37030 [Terrabacter aerolatus]